MYRKLNLHTLFEAGVIVKGVHAVVELVSAFVVYFFGNEALLTVTRLTRGELIEDPGDVLTRFLISGANDVFSVKGFIAVYLIASAVVNLTIVAGLLSNRLRMYPAAMGILGLFVAYQAHRIFLTHSATLSAFTIFDILIIWLIYEEYQRQRRLKQESVII